MGRFHELISRERVDCGHVEVSSQEVGSLVSAKGLERQSVQLVGAFLSSVATRCRR
jgi:hypothetical protein